MNLKDSYREIYEETLKPAINDLDEDPFMSRDLNVDMRASVTGRFLSEAADKEGYNIEIVDKWPYVFSTEGNTVEDNSDEVDAPRQRVLSRVSQVLEKTEKMDDGEVYEVLNYLVDWYETPSAKMEEKGRLRERFKNLDSTDYSSEETAFYWRE